MGNPANAQTSLGNIFAGQGQIQSCHGRREDCNKHFEEKSPTYPFALTQSRVTVWRPIDITRKDLFMQLFASKSDDDTNDNEVESPYYQPEETGVQGENGAEQDAREDYNTEKEDSESDPIPDEPPDWASDLPSPKE
jgi:hypothetical protein